MYKNPNDAITRAELTRELALRAATASSGGVQFPGYASGTQLADVVILAARSRLPYVPVADPGETMTVAEVKAALGRLGYANLMIEYDKLYLDVVEHRESLAVGDIVRSVAGGVFILLHDGKWKCVTNDGTYNFDHPGRPLKKIGVAT